MKPYESYERGIKEGIKRANKLFKQGRGSWHVAHSCVPKQQYLTIAKELRESEIELGLLHAKCGMLNYKIGKQWIPISTVFDEYRKITGREYTPNAKKSS